MGEQENGHSHLDHRIPILKLMVITVDWEGVKRVTDILQERFVRFHYVCVGKGTASSDILAALGIGDSDKGLIFCLQPSARIQELMWVLHEKLNLGNPGNGIAFSLPLSGVCNPMSHIFSDENISKFADMLKPEAKEHILSMRRQAKERWESHMQMEQKNTSSEHQYDLIVSVINQGYTDELMDKAKSAGARGGTIIHARRVDTEDFVKFFGISVQAEKEIVLILAKHETRNDIMKTISQNYGMTSDAKGIILSLPVDSVTGLGID